MAILKCKMCGGDVELSGDKTFGTCEYCGCTMTFPKVDDDQRAAAFNRGNHFRRIGEFDKALAVYERIVQEDDTDAEAHWCCALCRFGIEYVEDPATMEWIPTCHRASFDSFLEDVDYLAAVKYSDGITQRQYQKDAAKIAEVQRGILATSQNAEPYDVFICYKETDAQGNRTKDSLMAQDIYYQLTEQGRKVFFARITLEDVAGAQYEPYIFAALNSAKVMIVVGTSAEHLNAVWVKNEWSRFLSLMKKDHSKLLLPCYRDMDPYDLPEQLSVLQSYDMGKIGFIQDLIRGVAKVLDAGKQTAQTTVVKETIVTGGGGNAAPLLKRAFMFLQDGDWSSADEYCEKVLDIDPECAEAYLAKLMAEMQIKTREGLKDCTRPFDQYNNYQKAMRFGDANLQAELKGYISFIIDRNLTATYNAAVQAMNSAATSKAYKTAASQFSNLGDFKDAAHMVKVCLEKAEEADREEQYQQAVQVMNRSQYNAAAAKFRAMNGYKDAAEKAEKCWELAEISRKDAILSTGKEKIQSEQYDAAIKIFESIPGWKDADKQIEICRKKIAEKEAADKAQRLKEEQEAQAKAKRSRRKKLIAVIGVLLVILGIAGGVVFSKVILPNRRYDDAVALMKAGRYTDAIAAFEELNGHKDSAAKIQECWYGIAEKLSADEDVAAKAIAYGKAGDYKDAKKLSFALWDTIAVRETISAGEFHTVGLKADGTVVAVGENDHNQCDVSEWTDIVAISASNFHTVGLKADGTVVAVGWGRSGQCDVSEWTNIVAISADNSRTIGLKADGTVVAAGANDGVSEWKDIVAISAGYSYTIGLKVDGTVVAAGYNYNGEGNVSDWKDVVAISAGYHTVGLKADGTVVVAGSDDAVSDWADIVAISAYDHAVGLKADGTVVAVGYDDWGQCNVSEWKDIVAISAGWGHTVGLKADGTVVAVGNNARGQCNVSDWDLS